MIFVTDADEQMRADCAEFAKTCELTRKHMLARTPFEARAFGREVYEAVKLEEQLFGPQVRLKEW